MYTVRAYMGEDLMLDDSFEMDGLSSLTFECDMFCADYCIDKGITSVHAHFEALDEDGALVEVYEVHYSKGDAYGKSH